MFGKKTQSTTVQSQPPKKAQLPATVEVTEATNNTDLNEASNDLRVTQKETGSATSGTKGPGIASYRNLALENNSFMRAKQHLLEQLIEHVDFIALGKMEHENQKSRLTGTMDKFIQNMDMPLTSQQLTTLKEQLVDELFGFGPLEPLLKDPDVSDIMVNSGQSVYVEKAGKIIQTDVTFYDEMHLLGIIQRIVSRVGRRVDEASPMVDARMPDGSRFNAIIPPLALDGSLVSIRKFKKNKMPLSAYVEYQSMSPQMATFLEICGYIGLNIIVSGGTGSGKTTLLNALSGGIGHEERIITIEDAAELQLQQPHVLRLETRPASMEGRGEITQRQLVKNALRMRPDRIILGEIRGDEVIDVLAAMNTGHDGSMATIHANNPRDSIARIENLVGMSGVAIGTSSLRRQISSAVQLIVQVERHRDGRRRVTYVEEIVGIEGDIITTQTLFSFKQNGMDEKGNILGEYISHGIRPKMLARAQFFGKEHEVLECFGAAM
jgi:pilus assembly protein CpaF